MRPLTDFPLVENAQIFKVWNQCQHMLSIRNEIMMLPVSLSFDLTDYQDRVSNYTQEFDS